MLKLLRSVGYNQGNKLKEYLKPVGLVLLLDSLLISKPYLNFTFLNFPCDDFGRLIIFHAYCKGLAGGKCIRVLPMHTLY